MAGEKALHSYLFGIGLRRFRFSRRRYRNGYEEKSWQEEGRQGDKSEKGQRHEEAEEIRHEEGNRPKGRRLKKGAAFSKDSWARISEHWQQ